MKPTQHTQPKSSIVFATCSCKIRFITKLIPTLAAILFAILPAATSNAATPTLPAIAAGSEHGLHVTSDGKLWTMGWNEWGQLGNGTTNLSTSPTAPVQVATNVAIVAAGYFHSLFVTADGKLYAMGENDAGQLGDGTTTNRNAPVQVPSFANVTAVAANEHSSFFATADGKVYAMGDVYFDFAFPGVSDFDEIKTPRLASGIANVTAIAAGDSHYLFVTADGKLYTMGYNYYGQLGNGTTQDSNATMPPAQVPGFSNVTAAAAGWYHSLFVTADGRLYAMGDNEHGQLGNGTTTNSSTPVQVPGFTNVTAVAAATYHSLFVTADGKLYAMGYNNYGQLGIGTYADTSVPVQVPGFNNVIAVATGELHSFFLTADGKLYAMGLNAASGLGDGSFTGTVTGSIGTVTTSNIPVLVASGVAVSYAPAITAQPANQTVTAGDTATFTVAASGNPAPTYQWQSAPSGSSTWTPISGATAATLTLNAVTTAMNGTQYRCVASNSQGSANSNAATLGVSEPLHLTLATSHPATIAAGSGNSWYVANDGKLWAMGSNSIGVLGDGTTINRSTPVQVASDVMAVAASSNDSLGSGHCLCVTNDGKLWAVGSNYYGQFGDGTNTPYTGSATFVQVASDVVVAAAGGFHSLYVTSDGKLWAMGRNSYGQLGNGTTTNSSTPVQVATNVIAAAAGNNHTLYITSDGKLWAVGQNNQGQLGDGTTTDRSTPVQVATNVIAVTAGGGYSLYITSDGKLWAMGSNSAGQLGDGTTTDRHTPVQVVSNVIAIAAGSGGTHSLYITNDGRLYAMGWNFFGQLGDGTTTDRHTPVQIASNVTAIAAGDFHSLYVTSDGELWAVGFNSFGQLGDGTTTDRHTPVPVASGLSVANNSSFAPVITVTDSVTGTVGSALTYTINATNSPTSFNATGLPDGLSLNVIYGSHGDVTGGGEISGTPTTSGTYNATLFATNFYGTGSAMQQFIIADSVVTPPATPTITNVSPSTASAGATIIITGTNLTGATVTIGGQPATVVSISTDGKTLTVIVPENTTSSTIVITTPAGSPLTVTQPFTVTPPPPPVTPALTVDKITLSLAQPANSTATFSITSNIAWVTSIDPATASSWLSVNPNAATGNSSVTTAKAASANTTGAPRTASIVVTGSGNGAGITRTLIATQAALAASGYAPTGATLPVGATLTLTTTDTTAPAGSQQTTRAYTVIAGNKLTTTDAAGTLTLAYEYSAAGNTGTLVIPDLDAVYSLKFTNATTGALTLYTIDDTGNPLDLTGTFAYAPPAATTYTLTVNNGAGAGTYAANTTVTITANTAPTGQVFDKWTTATSGVTFANATAATTTITMPATAATVTATYKTPTTGGGGNTGGSGSGSGGGGGGGGGAPSLLYLGAAVALAALRGAKRK